MIRRPPRSTRVRSSAASDVYKRQDRMPLVTALGCSVTALVAACCAVQPDALIASVTGLAVMGAAAERAGVHAAGPGSLRMHLLDELAALDLERLAASLDVIAATA